MAINLIVHWTRGCREPWHLATSPTDPLEAVRMHRRRMLSEQCFKGGMHYFTLDRSMVAATGRLQTLLVGMPLDCCLLAVTG